MVLPCETSTVERLLGNELNSSHCSFVAVGADSAKKSIVIVGSQDIMGNFVSWRLSITLCSLILGTFVYQQQCLVECTFAQLLVVGVCVIIELVTEWCWLAFLTAGGLYKYAIATSKVCCKGSDCKLQSAFEFKCPGHFLGN